MWVQCHHCGYWFDNDKANENHGVVWVKGKIEGYICPFCKSSIPTVEKYIQEKVA